MAPLPPRELRHPFLRYDGPEYTDADVADFEERGGDGVPHFLGPPPSYTLIRDPVFRLCHQMMAHSIAGRSQAHEKAQYLRRFSAGRKSRAHIFGGQFVARLAAHFGLLTTDILGGLTVIVPKLPIIDMGELVRLWICMEVDDTWAWVAMGPERQLDAAASAPVVAEDAPAADEGDQAVLAPVQAPQQPPPLPQLLLGLCRRD
ncbi:hypothetical protein Tco_0204834 [Tanacetum coccineum]